MPALRPWIVLTACIGVGLLNEVSGAVIGLSIADALRDFQAEPSWGPWILLLGKLSFGALIFTGGALGDRFGQRLILIIGAGVVILASALSAWATSASVLAVGRALDGLGNALASPLALAIALAAFPSAMRPRVVGIFLAFSGLGVVLGPLTAGALVQAFSWRVGFVAPVSLAILGAVVVATLAPVTPLLRREGPDKMGLLLCALGLFAVAFGFIEAGRQGWLHLLPWGAELVGVLLLGVFVWWELKRAATPLIAPTILRSRPVLVALLAALLAALVINGTLLPLLYFFRRVHHQTPVEAILHLMPLALAAVALAPFVGAVAEKKGRRLVMSIGAGGMLLGCLFLALLTPETPYLQILGGLILLGAGMIAVVTPCVDLVMAASAPRHTGAAAALNGAVSQLGGAIGIGVIIPFFLAQAQSLYLVRMADAGYTPEVARESFALLRQIIQAATAEKTLILPPQLETTATAAAAAFSSGVGAGFGCGAVISLVILVSVFLGMRPENHHHEDDHRAKS